MNQQSMATTVQQANRLQHDTDLSLEALLMAACNRLDAQIRVEAKAGNGERQDLLDSVSRNIANEFFRLESDFEGYDKL